MARGALLHELGEDPGIVGLLPFRGQLGEHSVAHRAAAPVRDDRFFVELEGLGLHPVPGLGAGVEDAEVLETVAGQLGERRGRFWARSPLADDEFLFAQVNGLVAAEVQKGQRSEHGSRVAALVGLVEFGNEPRAFP